MSLSIEYRRKMIDEVKKSMPQGMAGSRDETATRGTILTALAFGRGMGFTKDEMLALVKEEWLHLTSIDNRTVKGEK